MSKSSNVINCKIEEDICEEMGGLEVSKTKAPFVYKADRRFQAFALWAEAQTPTSTPESRAALEHTMCIFGAAQQQLDFLAKFEPNIELALIEGEQKARASRVSMTRATLDGRPAFVDELGCYYEAVAIARA
jgi:hypothetical protein